MTGPFVNHFCPASIGRARRRPGPTLEEQEARQSAVQTAEVRDHRSAAARGTGAQPELRSLPAEFLSRSAEELPTR